VVMINDHRLLDSYLWLIWDACLYKEVQMLFSGARL
jgi:hypothetical protein